MRNDAIVQFKRGIRRIIGPAFIGFALLVNSFFDMRGAQTRNGFYFSENMIEHITPVTKHICDNASIVIFAVVPAGTLRRNGITFKNPVSELTAHRKNFSKESILYQSLP